MAPGTGRPAARAVVRRLSSASPGFLALFDSRVFLSMMDLVRARTAHDITMDVSSWDHRLRRA
jgi:hypothetical protein